MKRVKRGPVGAKKLKNKARLYLNAFTKIGLLFTYFRILSADAKGNPTFSKDYNLVTPAKEKSILQLILKQLEETFSWTRNVGQFFRGVGQKAR